MGFGFRLKLEIVRPYELGSSTLKASETGLTDPLRILTGSTSGSPVLSFLKGCCSFDLCKSSEELPLKRKGRPMNSEKGARAEMHL